jgi:long-subunit fatty acid transport protein
MPRSVNLDFQTGIAEGTLLTAGFRWAEWGSVDLKPTVLGSDLIGLKDSRAYSLGVARRFNENFAGSVTFDYEEASGEPVSSLGPVDGVQSLTIGGRYSKDGMNISGGINYSWLGDANAKGSSGTVATFTDNSSVGLGLNVNFSF